MANHFLNTGGIWRTQDKSSWWCRVQVGGRDMQSVCIFRADWMQRFRAAVPKWRVPSRDVRVCDRHTWSRASKRSGHMVCVVRRGRCGTFGVNTINAGWRMLRKGSCRLCFGLLTYPMRRVVSNQKVQPKVATTMERRIKIISSMGLLCRAQRYL